MPQDWAALGTTFSVQDTTQSPPVWYAIALIDDIQGPKIKRTIIDTTTHDVTDGYVRKLGSLKDGQQVMLTVVWDPTDPTHNETGGYTSIKGMLEDGIRRNCKVVYPVSPVMRQTFLGFCVAYEPGAKVKDALRATFTIEVSGKSTLAAGN